SVLIGATFGIIAMFSYNVGAPVYPVATPGVSARFEKDDVTIRGAVYEGHARDDHGIPNALDNEALLFAEAKYDWLQLGIWHHTEHGNGYYAVADKQIAPIVGAFSRLAIAPDNALTFYIDSGIRIGPGPLRERDFFSVGLAFAKTMDLGPQTIAEATYQILVQ